MEISIRLSEQEYSWLKEIAEHHQTSIDNTIKQLIKESHEQLCMDRAFDLYPQNDEVPSKAPDEDSRAQRKAALKKNLIDKAMQSQLPPV